MLEELLAAVDAAFAITARDHAPWADPHPDRTARDEEYSRVTDPAKWRIVGARAEAWMVAVVDAGLAVVETPPAVVWASPPGPVITRTERVVPFAVGAIPLLVARTRFGNVDDTGVVLGAGDPVEPLELFPDCGCDACDSGSQDELDRLDLHVLSVVLGTFRRLTRGERTITVLADGWSASNFRRRRDAEAVLADPSGWRELRGASWLSGA